MISKCLFMDISCLLERDRIDKFKLQNILTSLIFHGSATLYFGNTKLEVFQKKTCYYIFLPFV